jgi:hypothetical protein
MGYVFVKEGGNTGDVGAPSADRVATPGCFKDWNE